MKLKDRNKKILTAFLLGLFVIGFSLTCVNQIVTSLSGQSTSCFPLKTEVVDNKPVELIAENVAKKANSSPLALVFQLMFILFLISPPIIALMLFCIWKELKKSNDLK